MSEKKKRKAYILRGPSGCGKSVIAEQLRQIEDAVVCSADEHFIDKETGEYVFVPSQIAEAHANCMQRFIKAANDPEVRAIVVDNTNINAWEYQNYVLIASHAGMEIRIMEWRIETIDQLRACIARNQHGTPAEVIARMALGFEPHPDGVPMLVPLQSQRRKLSADSKTT